MAASGPFTALVAIDVTVYACALMLEFAALIAMRIRYPDAERPYRVPGGWLGIAVITFFPAAVTALAVYFQNQDVGPMQTFGWAGAALATGPIAYLVLRPLKRRSGIDRSVDLETGELVG